MAYCQAADLLTGNIPTPAQLSPDNYVNDAADEIDSKIGFIYETPVNISDTLNPPLPRPVPLLLKRINVHLATGRLLMAADAAGEDNQLHAYAKSLVDDAEAALALIASGELVLTGVPRIDSGDGLPAPTAPLVSNIDDESQVEAFYDRIANPNFSFFGLETPRGFVR